MIKKQIGVSASFKDADIKQGIITGYLSHFGNRDSDGDVIQSGSYSKTIKESGPSSSKPRIKYLQDHNTTKCVGVFTVLKEDNIGLYYEAKAGRHTLGQDYLLMCEDGIITEHSVGFETVKQQKMQDHNLITEIKLWEGSGLQCWGANSDTPLTGVKSHEEIAEMFKKLEKALKHGSYTDESMRDFQTKYNEIAIVLEQQRKEMEAKKEQVVEQTKTTERERIELKGLNWFQYEALPDDKKESWGFIARVEEQVECIARCCGEAMLKDNPFADTILSQAKTLSQYLEKAEDAILNGTGIIEDENQEDVTTDTEEKSNKNPNSNTKPSSIDTQPIESKGLIIPENTYNELKSLLTVQ